MPFPSTTVQACDAFYTHNSESIIQDFFTFLRFRSVSSEPAYQDELLACVDWLKKHAEEIGFAVELWQQAGHHPVLFASYDGAGPSKPTLLLYNHYDVQPVDPLDQWISPPFEPTLRNGEVYARGAQDNKGQCFYVLQALRAYYNCFGAFPINVKWCIDGQEEMGSEGLSLLLKHKQQQLHADYLAIVDMGLERPQEPVVTLGVRGLFTMDIELEGSHTDLHSGSHGGIVYNPIHALTALLARVRDERGHITIPGFYDDVVATTPEERAQIALDFDADAYAEMFGASTSGGEQGYAPLERAWLRPTFEINGIEGGYHGPGFKTVIPAKAVAKVSCRLVPNQEPEKMAKLVSAYLEQHIPPGMKMNIHVHPGKGSAIRACASSPIVQAFARAYADIFGTPCRYIFSGGSIPIIADLTKASAAQVVLVGLGLPDDSIHAPNEHFGIDRLHRGFLTIVRTLELLGNAPES